MKINIGKYYITPHPDGQRVFIQNSDGEGGFFNLAYFQVFIGEPIGLLLSRITPEVEAKVHEFFIQNF